jgi:aminobenzoyl-glutamate transport protein
MQKNIPDRTARRGWFTRFLDTVEWLGNLLPHPVTLFALLALSMILISGLFGVMGVSVPDPRPSAAEGAVIEAVSLMNAAGLRRILENLVSNFVNFAPLGVVLVAMLGVGIAEKSGLLSAMVRGIVLSAPKHVVTVAIVFAGVISNTASEMGYVVLVPLAGAIFLALGRHPLAGMAAAFAGVSGGYSANLLIGTVDPLLAGITQEAARLIDPTYEVYATANWYFMAASTFLITTVGSLVTIYIVEPKLGEYDDSHCDPTVLDNRSMENITATERKGLAVAGVAALAVFGLMALLAIPEGAPLRDPVDGSSGPFFPDLPMAGSPGPCVMTVT